MKSRTHALHNASRPCRRRRLPALLLCLALSFSVFGGLAASAAAPVSETVASAALNDRPAGAVTTPITRNGVEILSGEAFRVDGVTYVPLRKFCELFADCRISWNSKTNTATVRSDKLSLYATTGNYYIQANDRYLYTVGRILNISGTLFVPIRPLAKAFAADLSWNAAKSRVELTAKRGTAIAPASYRSDDVYWLSRIIYAEAGGEPFLGQIAVGNVVINRKNHASYPNTVYGVIFDRKHGTQFSPVAFGTIYRKPSEQAVIAAKICLEGYTLSDTALFFMNPRIATSNWISKNRPFAFTIGNHDFYD